MNQKCKIDLINSEKECLSCKLMKSFENFSKCRGSLKSKCKSCLSEESRVKRKNLSDEDKNKIRLYERNRSKRLSDNGFANSHKHNLKKYNLSVEEYNEMIKSQSSLCAICGNEESSINKYGNKRRLAVDHCHATGKIRYLLCGKCNQALGLLNENKNILQKMIEYLEEFEEKE